MTFGQIHIWPPLILRRELLMKTVKPAMTLCLTLAVLFCTVQKKIFANWIICTFCRLILFFFNEILFEDFFILTKLWTVWSVSVSFWPIFSYFPKLVYFLTSNLSLLLRCYYLNLVLKQFLLEFFTPVQFWI